MRSTGGRWSGHEMLPRMEGLSQTHVNTLTLQILPGNFELYFDGSRPVTIGRELGVDVVVPGISTSRQHGLLRLENGAAEGGTNGTPSASPAAAAAAATWVYEDKSSNGTYLDGKRVTRVPIDRTLVLSLGAGKTGTQIRLTPPQAVVPDTPPVTPSAAGTGPAAPQTSIPAQAQAHAQAQAQAQAPTSTPAKKAGEAGAAGKAAPSRIPAQGQKAQKAQPVQQQAQPVQQHPRPAAPVFTPGSPAPAAYTGVVRTHQDRMRIGRALDNEIVVDDLLASRYHAELRKTRDGGYEIADLGTHNGTFVDGRRISGRSRLDEGSLVAVGHTLLRLRHGHLEGYVDHGQASFAALDLGVLIGQKALLDSVSFGLEGGQFLAVLGPTGAGKSTLLKALTGFRPADKGTVLYNGRDVYSAFDELRNRIGYVPQDDILHPQLTVRAALEYAAELRFPPDTASHERSARVDEVMQELGLDQRADVRVERLSGGQRKRTSVALELLTRPSLLILDEPTSGLDPGYEKSVMQLLRQLADGGRTVLTVTHSIQSLDLCDRILFLAPGGQTAYFGPPRDTLPFFNSPGYPEIFQLLDKAEPGVAKAKFDGSDIEAQYVAAPLAAQRGKAQPEQVAQPEVTGKTTPHATRQLWTLTRRYTALIVADRRNTLLLLAQAPILGLLMVAAFGKNNLVVGAPGAASHATTVLLALTLAASYLGASNSIREIVKERAILVRERSVGLSVVPYVLSKFIVLGTITVVQSFIMVYLALSRQGGLAHGEVFGNGRVELALVVSLSGLCSMALGLWVSSLAENADKVMTILPVILFAQFVLCGAAFAVQNTTGLNQLAYFSSARWSYSAEASTADLDLIESDGCNGTAQPGIPGRPGHPAPSLVNGSCDPAHAATAGAWSQDMGLLLGLTVLFTGGTCVAVRAVGRPKKKLGK
jgi:ABC-type multidrug transport system ATPase subunit/pSer/pThr/pTyr-binding forkhead associated (FHA) protein